MATSPTPSRTPRIAVVTVSFGSGDVLGNFFASLEAASVAPVAVVVVDNRPDSEHGVGELVAQAGATYLPLEHNGGYGAGMNAGVASLPAEIEWVLISNPDIVLHADAIDRLIETAITDDRIAAVGPTMLTDGEIYPSARAVPSLRTGVGHALLANVWVGNPWSRAYKQDTDGAHVRRDVGWLSGACFLVRRSAFVQLGGFDEGYFMYFEDVDLGYRLGRAGFRSVYEPAATVTHTGAHSTGSSTESARMIAAHHASARRFLNRKYSSWILWPLRVALSVGLSVRSAVLKRRSGHH